MSSSNCCFLTCIQVSQEIGKVVWYFHFFNNFPQFVAIHTVKDFSIVDEAAVDFLWNSLSFSLIQHMLRILISGSSAFSKSSLNIWKFRVHILLKPGLENFEHYFASVWYECNCAVVWVVTVTEFILGGSKITAEVTAAMKLKDTCSLEEKLWPI